jgi:hypothetical protein
MSRLLPLFWIASVALASTAHAEPTKVALAIEGDSSSIGVRKAVVNAFSEEDDLQFVSAQKTTRAIEQLGIGEVHTTKDAKSIAKKLAVAAVVQGEFDESDHTLTLIVYANGKKPGSFTIEAEDTKSASFKKNVRKKMFAKLDGATNVDASADSEATSDHEDIKAKAGKKSRKNADKADKKHDDDDEVADESSDKKSSRTADKKHGKNGDKADKKHGHDDEDVADKKSGKDSERTEKRHGRDEDIASDKAHKKHGPDDEDIASDKADKKHGRDDEDISSDKADKKHGKTKDDDKAHGRDEDVASDNGDKKSGKDDKADKKHADDDDAGEAGDDETDSHRGTKVAASDDDDDEAPTSVHVAVGHDAPIAERNFAAARIDLGASMIGRSLRFQSSAVDGAPSGYHAKPVPGGYLGAELYPLAFKDPHRVIAGIGLGGDFDQARSFTIPTTDGFGAEKVTERSYSVGARFRIAFGHRATSPTVTIGAGYGTRTFATDHSSGMTTGVPDVAYRMIVPSISVRVPIGSRVTAFAGGRGMLMLSAGPITNADQYGRASAMGGTATAGVEVGLASHVALRLAAEGTQVDLKFYGQGTLSSMLDGDPSTIDVQRARDRYYGGDATIAVTY